MKNKYLPFGFSIITLCFQEEIVGKNSEDVESPGTEGGWSGLARGEILSKEKVENENTINMGFSKNTKYILQW